MLVAIERRRAVIAQALRGHHVGRMADLPVEADLGGTVREARQRREVGAALMARSGRAIGGPRLGTRVWRPSLVTIRCERPPGTVGGAVGGPTLATRSLRPGHVGAERR